MTPTVQIVLLVFVGFVALGYLLRGRSQLKTAGLHQNPDPSVPLMGPSEIEDYVREHINEIAVDQFPDNTEEAWQVLGFQHQQDFIFAEAEPDSDQVGYPKFTFCFPARTPHPPQPIACYCFEDGKYSLLSTAPGVALKSLPRILDF